MCVHTNGGKLFCALGVERIFKMQVAFTCQLWQVWGVPGWAQIIADTGFAKSCQVGSLKDLAVLEFFTFHLSGDSWAFIHLQHLVMNCFLSCFSSPQEERTGLFPLRLLSNQFFTKAINNVPVAVLTTFTPMDEKGLPLSTYIIEFPCPDSSFPLGFHCATFQIHRKGKKKNSLIVLVPLFWMH